jgi:ribonuclease HII
MATPHHHFEHAHAPLAVCGVDEVGRGPLAGPVVAAAVLYSEAFPEGLTDSKKLSASKREIFAQQIMQDIPYGIGIASVEEIDRLNILQATMCAMQRAVTALALRPDIALIDGNRAPDLGSIKTQTIVKGDQQSISIAAASVVAKVTRDRMMQELACIYPEYGFEQHAGYGTAQHLYALARFGACPAHRRSFAPIKKLLAA